MGTTSSNTETRELFGAERRQTKRIPLAIQIEVSGREGKRGAFRDRTVTIDVSESGCRFRLDRELKRGDELAIVCEKTDGGLPENQPALFHVVWSEPYEDGSLIGAMQLRSENVWPAALMA
jgi:hypothetical protein